MPLGLSRDPVVREFEMDGLARIEDLRKEIVQLLLRLLVDKRRRVPSEAALPNIPSPAVRAGGGDVAEVFWSLLSKSNQYYVIGTGVRGPLKCNRPGAGIGRNSRFRRRQEQVLAQLQIRDLDSGR